MSVKRASYSLMGTLLLFIGIFAVYLESPFNPGIYFMGIGVLCLLIFCSIALILFAKKNIFIKINTIRLVSLLILGGYIFTILVLVYIFWIWFIFIVPWG